MNIKLIVAIIGILLTLVAYVPYIVDTVRGNTRPHSISWLIWSLLGFVVYTLQLTHGGGYGTWITGCVLVIQILIFFLSLRFISRDVCAADLLFLVLAVLGLVIWICSNNDTLSIVYIVSISLIGYIPTIMKIHRDPHSETLSTYAINSVRHAFGIYSLHTFNLITLIHPGTWSLINALLVFYIWKQRRNITNV